MHTSGTRRMLVSEFAAPYSMFRPRTAPALISGKSSAFEAAPGD